MHYADMPLLVESNPDLDDKRFIDTPDGFKIMLGEIPIVFIHTPGHSKGSQCVLVNDDRLLTGDTMFVGYHSTSYI
jgi:glyoxylase-like metal-dependent hydrolase (beta-lactamase superfamily II)